MPVDKPSSKEDKNSVAALIVEGKDSGFLLKTTFIPSEEEGNLLEKLFKFSSGISLSIDDIITEEELIEKLKKIENPQNYQEFRDKVGENIKK